MYLGPRYLRTWPPARRWSGEAAEMVLKRRSGAPNNEVSTAINRPRTLPDPRNTVYFTYYSSLLVKSVRCLLLCRTEPQLPQRLSRLWRWRCLNLGPWLD